MTSNTLRIAVCLYGQPRTALYCIPWIKQTFNNLNGATIPIFSKNEVMRAECIRNEPVQVEIDYFLNIKQYNVYINSIGDKKEVQVIDNNVISTLLDEYAPKDYKITTHDEEVELYTSVRTSYTSMFSSINTCLTMKKRHEIRTGKFYDLCAIHRYDSLLGPNINSLATSLSQYGIRPMSILACGHLFRWQWENTKLGINDLFLCGDNFAIDTAFSNITRMYSSDSDTLGLNDISEGPNVTLFDSMMESSVRVLTDKELMPALVRPNANLTLPVMDNWQYHQIFWTQNHASKEL